MRALLFGNRYFQFNESVAAAFRSLGWMVSILDYQDAALEKTSSSNPYRKRKYRARFEEIDRSLVAAIETEEPDIFFTLSGNVILPSRLRWLKKRGLKLVLYLLDSIHTLPTTRSGLKLYDLVYAYEPTDIPFITGINSRAFFLPPGYNPDFYRPLELKEKTYDIAFVGTPYGGRLEILNNLLKGALRLDLGVALVGKYWHRGPRHRIFKLRYPFIYRFILKNGAMNPPAVNLLYNQSRIVLNHHFITDGTGVNPRLFDIAGSGSFQLVDKREKLEMMFTPQAEVETYSSVDELVEKARYYLDRPRAAEEIARAALKRARKEHTYLHRVRRILADLDNLRDFREKATA
jgi:spore maturation protein CgeB